MCFLPMTCTEYSSTTSSTLHLLPVVWVSENLHQIWHYCGNTAFPCTCFAFVVHVVRSLPKLCWHLLLQPTTVDQMFVDNCTETNWPHMWTRPKGFSPSKISSSDAATFTMLQKHSLSPCQSNRRASNIRIVAKDVQFCTDLQLYYCNDQYRVA